MFEGLSVILFKQSRIDRATSTAEFGQYRIAFVFSPITFSLFCLNDVLGHAKSLTKRENVPYPCECHRQACGYSFVCYNMCVSMYGEMGRSTFIN